MKTLTGVFRSDTNINSLQVSQAGHTFSSNLIQQIEIDLGADATIFDGDSTNEVPNDPTQTYDDGNGPGAFSYDFSVRVVGSDGVNYEIVVFDYDVNNDGNFGNGTFEGEDPNENNIFFAFRGAVPPPNITLTTTNIFTDNEPFRSVDNMPPCFTAGTLIETPDGLVAVDDLATGMRVMTQDNGAQPIRWVGSKKLDAIDLAMQPKMKPILIRAGALGKGYPAQDLIVSPQHRVLVRSAIAKRMFDKDEVLIPAIKLLDIDGIDVVQENPDGVEYFHILFDRHEIVSSNGALTESLFTGPQALKAIPAEARAEIEALFPEICDPDYSPVAARHIPEKGKLMKKLVERHQKNKKHLYADGERP